jgi:lysophospholipase L1-like esterase
VVSTRLNIPTSGDVDKGFVYDPATDRMALTSYAAAGDGSQLASLPYLMAAVADYNDVSTGTLTVLSLGSSVGAGAALANPSTDAPGAYFTTALAAKLNKLGNYTIQHYNGSVNGHVFADAQADYVTAKASATGTKVVVPLVFGMNDGRSDSYHSGQTYPGVLAYTRQIAADIRKDHADPVLFTTPHPHTGRMTWTTTSPIVYPASGVMTPDSTTAQSIKSITIASGRTINVSYRHLRVNRMIRRVGAELGITVIDAETYWFEAVADRGEDALFASTENVHPNLLGHQLSYWAAIDHWVKGFDSSKVVANVAPTPQVVWTELFNVQIASPIHLTFIDQQYAVLLIRAAHGGVAARHAEAYLCLGDNNGGTGSGVRVAAMGQLLGNVVTVSTSGYDVVITPNFNGATVAYTMIQGYPLP